jgi:hypothetical protein
LLSEIAPLLVERLPDVYERLLAAGVAEAPIATQMPASLTDRAPWPDDERLTMLMTRRATMDWVLQIAALAEPRVTVRSGVRVLSLRAVAGDPPHVTGVRTDRGEVSADVVVDTTGRRSPLDRWLSEIGARSATGHPRTRRRRRVRSPSASCGRRRRSMRPSSAPCGRSWGWSAGPRRSTRTRT